MTHHLHVPADPGRVDTLSAEELRYWCAEFDCTQAELLAAVAKVGDHATAVRDALKPPAA